MTPNLTTKVARGITWKYSSSLLNGVAQIVFIAIMARLIRPEMFGLVAMAKIAINFGNYFAELGLGQALIQRKDIQPRHITAAFSVSITLGIIFTFLLFGGAPAVGKAFDNTNVIPLLQVLSLNFLIRGIAIVPLNLLRREMRFKAVSLVEIGSYVIAYLGVGITLAVLGYGVWSLVAAFLSQSLIQSFVFFIIHPHSIKVSLHLEDYRDLFSFGSRVSLTTILTYIAVSAPQFVISRWYGEKFMGLFDRAQVLVKLPLQHLSGSINQVLFPSMSSVQNELNRLSNAVRNGLTVMSYLILPFCVAIAGAADEVVLVILGAEWQQSIPLFRLLAIAALFDYLKGLFSVSMLSTGRLNSLIIIQLFHIIVIAGLLFLLNGMGLIGVVWAVLIAEAIRFMIYTTAAYRQFKLSIFDLIRDVSSAAIVGILALSWVLLISATENLGISPLIRLASQAMGSGTILVCYPLLFKQSSFNQVLRQIIDRLASSNNGVANRFLKMLGRK